VRRTTVLLALLLVAALAAQAQGYKVDDPVPAGAKGEVSPLSGTVVPLVGIASEVSGKSEALNAALADLGATATPMEIRIELSSDVLFDFDKATLLPKAIPTLEKVATVLGSYPNAECTVEGHTDALGNPQYNQKLSERRADSVKTWLTAHGVNARFSIRGYGKTKPVAPNTLPNGKDNPGGRAKNRRVEIVVKKG
jgi:outer membrane protein OmpA-like peptidoglycan-associated protein